VQGLPALSKSVGNVADVAIWRVIAGIDRMQPVHRLRAEGHDVTNVVAEVDKVNPVDVGRAPEMEDLHKKVRVMAFISMRMETLCLLLL